MSLNADDQDAIEFADLAGEAMIGRPDLDSMIFSPCPAFGAGGSGFATLAGVLPALAPRRSTILEAPERDVALPSFILAIANVL